MKALFAALLLCAAARASETDGGRAPAERWTHPRGPASGSGRSDARAPRTFGGIRWSLKARGTILAPPVTWDGIAYIVDGKPDGATLLAVDASSGKVLARTTLKDPGQPRPAVWENSVFVLDAGRHLVQYRYREGRLTRRWSYDGGAGAGHARVLDGEIYLPTSSGLLRLRAGTKKPAWTAPGRYVGEPAIYRGHVYALRESDGKLALVAHKRSDGAVVTSCDVGAAGAGALRVAVGREIIAVELPGKQKWAIVAFDAKKPALKLSRVETFARPPIAGRTLLALDAKRRWTIFRTKGRFKVQPLVGAGARPDLVDGAPAPVVLGDLICFGTWLGQLETNRILWHLSERKDVTAFREGLAWSPVPTGHEFLLVVPKGGRSVHLIGKEEIG